MSESGLKFAARRLFRLKGFAARYFCADLDHRTLKRRIAVRCAAMLALMPAGAPSASAHPHIFVNARLEIVVDGQNRVQKLSQIWQFDPLFSSSVVLDFDKKGDRHLDSAELENVAETIRKSLAEFNYFQSVRADGKDIDLAPPAALTADIVDGLLVLTIDIRPRDPLILRQGGHYQFSLYDPSFYVAMKFKQNVDTAVKTLPAFCSSLFEIPENDKVLAKSRASLSEDFFASPDASSDLAYQLAPKLKVSCRK